MLTGSRSFTKSSEFPGRLTGMNAVRSNGSSTAAAAQNANELVAPYRDTLFLQIADGMATGSYLNTWRNSLTSA
jgi:hypothetical protein